MFVSTRRRFRRGDSRWDEYVGSGALTALSEVRSIDSALNRYATDAGDIACSPETVEEALGLLPAPRVDEEYQLLAVNLDADADADAPISARWRLLGYDLSDETQTSSLLNCGPWLGRLEPFAARRNSVGLLASRQDAEAAQRLLPEEWGKNMDHAHVVVWAVYERV